MKNKDTCVHNLRLDFHMTQRTLAPVRFSDGLTGKKLNTGVVKVRTGKGKSGLKQRWSPSGLEIGNEGFVSRERKAIREKIEAEPKIRNWFQELTRLST